MSFDAVTTIITINAEVNADSSLSFEEDAYFETAGIEYPELPQPHLSPDDPEYEEAQAQYREMLAIRASRSTTYRSPRDAPSPSANDSVAAKVNRLKGAGIVARLALLNDQTLCAIAMVSEEEAACWYALPATGDPIRIPTPEDPQDVQDACPTRLSMILAGSGDLWHWTIVG